MKASPIRFASRLIAAVCFAIPLASIAQYNTANWSTVDRYALSVPTSIESDLQALGSYLGAPYSDQVSKLRAVYRWVTDHMQYDIASYRNGSKSNQTALQVLKARIATCEGFSNLFEELARNAGAPVVTVVGYVKDSLHQKGEEFSETNHAWNLVSVDGRWLLIDSTWGAGFDDGTRFVKRFDPFYFLIPPEELTLTHYALEGTQRVGQSASNINEFRGMPFAPDTLLSIAKLGPQDIRRAMVEGFVNTYDLPRGNLTLRRGHVHKHLDAQQTFDWEIGSNVYEQFAVIHNDNWHYFTRTADGVFSASFAPTKQGKVQLAAKHPNEPSYTIFMEYAVK